MQYSADLGLRHWEVTQRELGAWLISLVKGADEELTVVVIGCGPLHWSLSNVADSRIKHDNSLRSILVVSSFTLYIPLSEQPP